MSPQDLNLGVNIIRAVKGLYHLAHLQPPKIFGDQLVGLFGSGVTC